MKQKWQKTPTELANFLHETMKDVVAEPKKMFGFPVYFINGNMFIGTFGNNLFLRFSRDKIPEILNKHKETSSFSPMPGRVMKEYLVIPEIIYRNKTEFSGLLRLSLAYAAALPPKQKKK